MSTTVTKSIAGAGPDRDVGRSGRPRSWSVWVWKSAVVVVLVCGGLWTATHGVAGATWHDVLTVLRALRLRQIAELSAIWLAGLAVYATVLSAALPGLGVRRSLLLNLTGSAVANLIPFGGALATGLNWRMVRTWGHSNLSFATFCILTNALDVAAKLVLPVVGVISLVLAAGHVPVVLWVTASICAAALLAVLPAQAVLLRTHRWARVLDPLRQALVHINQLLLDHWGRLLPASFLYVAAQVVLLEFSLRAVGLHAPLAVVLMAAAIERLGSLVPFTPGGAGFAEIGTIAWLVANGQDPVEVVAGVLVYRFFLIAMEVPLGGLLLGVWAWFQRSSHQVLSTPKRVGAESRPRSSLGTPRTSCVPDAGDVTPRGRRG
jgi:uncharacterized membrane protein YbhN (UPF0104 family)